MVKIALFAGLADLAGRKHISIDWEPGLTIGAVRSKVIVGYPQIEGLLQRSRAALGDQIVAEDARVPDGVELAFLPPVSGG
jgi:molybdopterin synthase catalytic subunit